MGGASAAIVRQSVVAHARLRVRLPGAASTVRAAPSKDQGCDETTEFHMHAWLPVRLPSAVLRARVRTKCSERLQELLLAAKLSMHTWTILRRHLCNGWLCCAA